MQPPPEKQYDWPEWPEHICKKINGVCVCPRMHGKKKRSMLNMPEDKCARPRTRGATPATDQAAEAGRAEPFQGPAVPLATPLAP